MKLVQEIRKNDLLSSNWGIYELSKAEANKYGNKFALSQGIFSDFGIKEFGADKLLSRLRNDLYEGFLKHKKKLICKLNL